MLCEKYPKADTKELKGLEPSRQLKVSRNGYLAVAAGSASAEILVRRLIALVFSFDELMSSKIVDGSTGKSSKRKRVSQEDMQTIPLDSWKIEQILGKCVFVIFSCYYDFSLIFFS